MSSLYVKLVSYVVAPLATVLLLSSVSSVKAQQPGPLLSERERLQRRMDQIYRSPIAYPKRSLVGRGPSAREIRRAAAKRIKEDAERIRFFNGEMMRAASASAALDYKSISKAAGEIKKSAARLSLNLGLPEFDEDQKNNQSADAPDSEQLIASLARLNRVISGLNADALLLGARGVLDAGQAAGAGRDLEEIIVLSGKIRKSAKELGRSSVRRSGRSAP
jgi:hypothetical protein